MDYSQYTEEYLSSLSDDEFEEKNAALIAHAKKHPLFQKDAAFRAQVTSAEKNLEGFSAAVAHEVATKLMHEIEIDGHIAKLQKAYGKMREAAIEAIVSNDPSREGMLKIAKEFIANEKAHGLHNPDDWKALEGIL